MSLEHADVHFRHSDEENDTEGVLLAKGISMVVLFIASMICGLAPLVLAKKLKWLNIDEAGDLKSKNKVVMTLLSFGGGVLLSTTFMHLMPEIEHNIEWLQWAGLMNEFDFSLTPLLTCSGFFIMYLVEELVHMYIHHREKKNGKIQPLVRNLSMRQSRSGVSEEKSVTNSTADLVEPKKDIESRQVHGHSHHHSHMPTEVGDDVTSALRGLLIVLALSIHELFEGLAVGLESSTSNVWYMLGAISAHKLVIAFCIGVELISARTKTLLTIVYITTFAIVSPMGIGIGMALVGGEGAAADFSSVILQGLASGTLLYVIFFEIWKGDRSGILQYVASVVGFFLMFGLQLLTPHTHSHGHSHDKKYMLGAISAHKLVIAFCIGIELIATRTRALLIVVYIITFAIVSPMGIGIGIGLVGGEGAAADFSSVILQGLASGTLLYVIFFEIWKGDRSGLLQYAGSLVGFFLMFGLKLLTPHTHSHGHSHDRK